MAQWRKVIVSGSNAELNNINSSGNVVPTITDGGSLGTSALNWSDLFLDSGAVVNFDDGDVTLTHSGNLLDIDGGNTRVDRLELDSASDYLDVDTDLKVVADADITLDPGGNNVKPGSDNADALGVSGTAWSDLFLGDGAVINFNAGDVTATHSSNLITITGGNTRVDRLEIDSASDYLDVDTDLQIVAAADVSINAGGGNVKPSANDGSALGVSGTAFSDLFLASGAVVNFNAGDVTLTHSANALTVDGGDVLVGDNNVSGSSSSTGSFGYLNVYGDGVFGGNLTFGDAATDSVSFGADIDSNLIPNSDDTYDLGSASQAWQDLFLEGDITLTDAGSVKATAGNLTVDSEAATLVLDGHTGVDIDATNSGKVSIDGAGGIDIGVAADVAIDVDASTFDLDASGALTMTSTTMAFDPSSTFDIDAGGAVTIDGSSITIGGDTDVAVDIDSSTLDIDASGALTIDSATSIAIGANADKPIDIDSTTLDIDSSGAITIDSTSTIAISGDDGATFSDDTEAIIYDGSGNLDIDSIALDIDASGSLTIDSDTSIEIGTTADKPIDIDSTTLDIDASDAVTIDSTSTISIDGADDMNFTITSGEAGEDLTIQQIGANDSSIIITAAGTGTDAVSIDATAGDMVIAPNLINGKTLTIGPSSATQMVFTPHGTAANEKISLINTSGTADDAIKIDSVAGGLTLAAGNDSLHIDADGTDSDALNIDSAGGIDVDAADTVDILAASTLSAKGATGASFGDDTGTWEFDGSGAVSETGMTTFSLTPSSTLDIDAGGAVTIDGSSITLGGDADVAFDIDTSTLDIDSSGAITIDSTDGVSIDGGAASNFTTTAGALTLDGDGGVNIEGNGSEIDITTAGATLDVNAGIIDIDATGGAVNIDSNIGINIGTTVDKPIDIDSTTLDIDASGALTIDSSDVITIDSTAGISIDGGAASNLTTSVGALTLDGADGVNVVGNSAEVDITTSGAVDINSGAFTLNGSTVGIDGTGALTLGASEMDIDADGGVINMDATSTITIGGTNATGVTIGKSDTTVTIPGSLDVNGTLTTIDTTNLKVADRFILMASGSSAGDGGIVVETDGAGSGTALGYDDSASRWALTKQDDTSHSSTTITPRQYVVSVSGSAADPSGNPSDFGSAAGDRIGMMHVNTSTGDVFIFS